MEPKKRWVMKNLEVHYPTLQYECPQTLSGQLSFKKTPLTLFCFWAPSFLLNIEEKKRIWLIQFMSGVHCWAIQLK